LTPFRRPRVAALFPYPTLFRSAEYGCRPFGNLRHSPGDIGDVVLVAGRRCFLGELGEEICGSERPHAAEDAEQRRIADFAHGARKPSIRPATAAGCSWCIMCPASSIQASL